MRKNRLFTALAAATLLVGTGAEVAQTTNPTVVQAAKKSKKAKKTSKKVKKYTITLKRKPTLYQTVTVTQNGKKYAQFKKYKNTKLLKALKYKKGSKVRVYNSVTTLGGDKYYYVGNVKIGKTRHYLYIKSTDVKSHSKGIPNTGKKADTSKQTQNQTQTVTLQVKRPTLDEYTKYVTGTVKQDTSNLAVLSFDSNNKASIVEYKDSNNNLVKWSKGKQIKIYAIEDLTQKNNANTKYPVYVSVIDGKYVIIPKTLVDVADTSVQLPNLTTFVKDYNTWFESEFAKNKEQATQDYIAQQKEAAAKKAASKKSKSSKKSTKKSKKSSKKTTKKSKKTSKK